MNLCKVYPDMNSKHSKVAWFLIDSENRKGKLSVVAYSVPKFPGCVLILPISPSIRPSSMPFQEYVTGNADAILHEIHQDAAVVEAMETDTERKEGLERKRQENGRDPREASIIFVPQITGSEAKVHLRVKRCCYHAATLEW